MKTGKNYFIYNESSILISYDGNVDSGLVYTITNYKISVKNILKAVSLKLFSLLILTNYF